MDGVDLIVTTDLDESGLGNYEPDAKLKTDDFQLPMRLQVGLSWDAYESEDVRATINVDGHSPNDDVQSVSVGTEIALMEEKFFIRAGLPQVSQVKINTGSGPFITSGKNRIQLFTAGLGINHQFTNSLNVDFDYAFQSYRYLNSVNRMSISFNF